MIERTKGFKWDEDNFDNDDDARNNNQENIDNIHDEEMKVVRDNIARSVCGS
jgi:alpha-glucosidase (family GH31 glycosyl hydrolase)